MKKLLPWLVGGFLVLFALGNPSQAADVLRSTFSSLVTFTTALTSGGGQ